MADILALAQETLAGTEYELVDVERAPRSVRIHGLRLVEQSGDTLVVDVSAKGDWSAVKVANAGGTLGRVNPINGFIYN